MTSSLKSALAWSQMWAGGVAPSLPEHRCLSRRPPLMSSQTARSVSRSKLPTQGGDGSWHRWHCRGGPWVWDPGSEEVDGNALPTHREGAANSGHGSGNLPVLPNLQRSSCVVLHPSLVPCFL